jgi:poly-beta-hydroxybutyrate-responsive repressor
MDMFGDSGHFGRGRGRGRHWQGRHSLLATRLLEPIVLISLQNGEMHGYTILEKLDQLGLGSIHPSMVYRLLRDMEEMGLVTSVWSSEQTQGPPRRIYTLTQDGKETISMWRKDLEQIKAIIDELLTQISETA